MISIHELAVCTPNGGGGESIVCRYCHEHLSMRFDYGQGHGVFGYSGHLRDCDALQAGLTVDLDMQDADDERAAFEAATPGEQKRYVFWKMAEAEEDAKGLGGFRDSYIVSVFAWNAIHYKARKREHV